MKTITIVGGGIAGLTLGIGLRQRGVPVVLWEAGRYPRHRVCGEFISGRGQAVLHRLGLHGPMVASGARVARTAAFYANSVKCTLSLPQPALCYSRFSLDQFLAQTFRQWEGELNQNARWNEDSTQPVVRATGRHPQPQVRGWRWFGLKAHARNLTPRADLELHFFSHGYVGLCQIENARTNVCGLFRSRTPIPDLNRQWVHYLGGDVGSELNHRAEAAEFDTDSFCCIAALCFQSSIRRQSGEFTIGDAFAAIAPLAGNGMSMALESAELALDPLERFSRNQIDWDEAQRVTRNRLTQSFAGRLRIAGWIQQWLFQPSLRRSLLALFARNQFFRELLFDSTR